VLTVAAAYLLNQSLQYLIPPPPFVMVERAWLVDSVVRGARLAETSAGAPRDKALRAMPSSQYLDFGLTRAAPSIVHDPGSLFAQSLRQSIASGLGLPVERVAVMTGIYDERNMERAA